MEVESRTALGKLAQNTPCPEGRVRGWLSTPPDSPQSSKQNPLSTKAEEPSSRMHHPGIYPSISAMSIFGGIHGSTQPQDAES